MILLNLPDDVVIYSPAKAVDEYGNPSLEFSRRQGVEPCKGWLQAERGSGGEAAGPERTSNVSYFRLYLRAGTSITAHDQVEVGGRRYSVEGDPYSARTLKGESHIVARVRLIAG